MSVQQRRSTATTTEADLQEGRGASGPPRETRRVIIERVQPQIDGGRFPIKRTPGESVSITADIFADGHDTLAGVLKYRFVPSGRPPAGPAPRTWQEIALTPLGNDAWSASFVVSELGEYEYVLEAWVEGESADRSHATVSEPVLRVTVDPERARFSAWYEMFPRSCTPDPARGGTLRDAEARLPAIAAMGFDVLYLPPVHPIGRTHRKGRNNALTAAPGDPGSPWAIGAPEGGHTAVDPGLGTLDDFNRFVQAAERHGMVVALDIALQASPDHPWVKEHPHWFRHRPDGSIQCAENPPKKYEDIYPFDFESRDWPALWDALRDVFLFWLSHGVRIFRVDNPHTKPFRFWEWVIGDVRRRHPDAIFLAEAFTRPAPMRHLAKAGFNQSYTYFTWRNSGGELREYLTELTRTELQQYMRPNFFANTPDILHEYLQTGGRPAFEVRLILAATLSATYGIYSGFELCENTPVRHGSEEYLHSEKYELRPRDWHQAGNLNELIARVNAIRRAHPALQFNDSLQFHDTDNPALLFFSKSVPSHLRTPAPSHHSNRIFVVANTDPHFLQHGHVRVPTGELGLGAGQSYVVEDLLDDATYVWRGDWNYVRLEPSERMAHILVIRDQGSGIRGQGSGVRD